MELFMRPMTPEERKYTYSQSSQLMGQTGSIGRLRGDFDSGGNGFFTSWDDHFISYNTDDFKVELDDVINHFRSDSGMLLKSRSAMTAFCREHPESEFDGNYCKEYGFRADTERFAYLIRCNPNKGDYNFHVFTYVSQWLDKHIQNAGRGIRFIDSRYNELFRINDGDSIQITTQEGERVTRPCRYIDEYHTEVGGNLYHICEFAGRMEQNGNTYAPCEPKPKEKSYER